jgi:hypothetical protein
MVLGPGPEKVRDAIFSAVQSQGLYKQSFYPQWISLLIKPWRVLQNESGTTPDQSAQLLFSDIDTFLANDCPKIEVALNEACQKLSA